MSSDKNQYKRPVSPLQKQWCRVLNARRVTFRRKSQQIDADEAKSYAHICQERYLSAFRRYNAKFRKEIEQLVLAQPSAICGMRVHRSFAITTLWPPLHSKKEINLFTKPLAVGQGKNLKYRGNTQTFNVTKKKGSF